MAKKKKPNLIGIGFDNKDKHTRITKGDTFHLVGGSKETHEYMQEKAMEIEKRTKGRDDIPPNEMREILREVL